jgi:MAF protein
MTTRAKPSRPLYLASSSPRRRQLLTQAGIAFELFVVPVDEDALTAGYTGDLATLGQYLALAKALAAREELVKQNKWGRILSADTTVLLDGRSLPKPRDLAEAETMLRDLRGREHIVATGVALAEENGCVVAATATTRVLMRDYSDEEIAAYVATGDPLDKAGAYSIQHPGFHPVAAMHGCHLGVIGLPICLVSTLLNHTTLPGAAAPDLRHRPGTCPWSGACTPPYPADEMGTPADEAPEPAEPTEPVG